MQGHQQSIDKRHDQLGLQLSLLHWVYDQMGVDEGNIQVMDGCKKDNGKLFNNIWFRSG